MASTTPSKSWMKEVRPGLRYQDGVDSFLAFAYKNSKGIDWYLCPCIKCGNVGTGKTLKELREHLICNGIMQSYTTWYSHGEPIQDEVAAEFRGVPNNAQGVSRIFSLVNDTLGNVQPENLDACMDEIINNDDIRTSHEQDPQVEECSNKSKKAKKLREDGSEPIYPSCKPKDTKLSVIVELVSLKSTGNWSDNSFDSLLKFLKRILPTGNSMPDNSHESLEMIKSLGMTYESIHACPNDCILYRKDHKDKTQCPKCGENRYKPEFLVKKKGVPKKVLRYFPLTPRLRRLYSIPWIAKMMKWHSNTGSPKGYMSHPADSSCWKGIDAEYPDFALEKRNVRLGLSTDGFNPFGNKSLSYSCWPVMIVPYNLPPSFCMLKEFTMLSSLIPGKSSPGKNIDVYLEPLVDELTDLWEVGSLVYDSSVDPSIEDPSFRMKAVLLGTIQDYPAYGYVAGCKTAGKYGCPICGEDITSIWLKYGRRFAYLGHPCFLSVDHVFRFQKSQFNGKEEHRKAPRRLTGDEVLNKVKKLKILIGRVTKRRRLCTDDEDGCTSWSKESSLFKLPYWKILVVRNNLDVTHVEKNMTENLLATIMGSSKTKDGLHARLDLKDMNIRGNLWPVDTDKGPSLPQAPFLLSKAEKVIMCQTLKNLKVPIGYSSNWFHNVSMEDLQIRCPKSHDYHIVMQQLLPVILMHAYKRQRPLGAAIRQLSLFFNVLCSKVINCKELELASKQIVEVLCVFEKCFPPSFFVSMTHLVVHLAEEARICGPVRFRWMYPFERMMKTYKMYVKNKRHPEGCIAERYLVEESILYCKEYLPSGSIGGHGRARKTMFEEAAECFDEHPIDKKGKRYSLSNLEYEQARRWVLESSDDVAEWREKYQTYKETHPTKRKRQRGSMAIEKAMDFIPWLRQQLEPKEMTTLKRLATGPSFKAISYNAYQSNGYRFCTSKSELRKTTQNSGVTMTAVTPFRSSAKDKNQVEREVSYYGIIKLILELDYYEFKQTVFYCDWVRIEDKVNGCVIDPETKLTFVNFRRFKTNTKKDDEPFVLASQASQVFYCKDPQRDDWHVVLNSPKRLTREIDAFADPLIFEPDVDIDAFGPTLAEEVLDEVIVDVV